MISNQILDFINYQIHYLHGLHVNVNSPLSHCRLEKYALIILFYELNKVWPCFNIIYVKEIILNSYSFKDIINKVLTYDGNPTI